MKNTLIIISHLLGNLILACFLVFLSNEIYKEYKKNEATHNNMYTGMICNAHIPTGTRIVNTLECEDGSLWTIER
jgi:hypothetical protein